MFPSQRNTNLWSQRGQTTLWTKSPNHIYIYICLSIHFLFIYWVINMCKRRSPSEKFPVNRVIMPGATRHTFANCGPAAISQGFQRTTITVGTCDHGSSATIWCESFQSALLSLWRGCSKGRSWCSWLMSCERPFLVAFWADFWNRIIFWRWRWQKAEPDTFTGICADKHFILAQEQLVLCLAQIMQKQSCAKKKKRGNRGHGPQADSLGSNSWEKDFSPGCRSYLAGSSQQSCNHACGNSTSKAAARPISCTGFFDPMGCAWLACLTG